MSGSDTVKLDQRLADDDLVGMISSERKETALAALKELARRQSPRRAEIFRAVLGDLNQDPSLRQTAATQLGTEHTIENQEILLRQLQTRIPSLFVLVARSLGKIGNEQALERLEQTKPPENETASRAHEFAKSLIAYRLRLNSHLIPAPSLKELVKISDGIQFTATPADGATIRQALLEARKDLPAAQLAEQGAVRISCREEESLLMFTAGFDKKEGLETLRERAALPLVLLNNHRASDRYFLDYYLFTHPSNDRRDVVLLGTRPTGEITFRGNIQTAREGMTFRLNSIDSRYAPAIDVEARYRRDRSWTFTKTLSDTRLGAQHTVRRPRLASRNVV